MLDFLTAVDHPGEDRIEVIAHLVDVDRGQRHLVRTDVPRAEPVLDSLVAVFGGAAWHEREAHEMFGVLFRGNPDLRPLLTTGDMGFPLRRTTPLPSRLANPWPGAFEPADRPPAGPGPAGSSAGGRGAARPRVRPSPPGIPDEWAATQGGPS
jgi:NADH-quinone oxidoreductase subunit C